MVEDRREKVRSTLHPLYLPVYDALCRLLPPEWSPYFGRRSFMEQDALYMQGRTMPGPIVTNAKGGESPHNYGCASDWTIFAGGRVPIWMKKDDPKWRTYKDACFQVKAKWGGGWDDCFHNELAILVSWKDVKLHYDGMGMAGAMDFIKRNRIPR